MMSFRRNILCISLIFVVGFYIISCTSSNNENTKGGKEGVRKTINGEPLKEISLSKDCIALVNDFDGEYLGQVRGSLVVVGNEPFTRLAFVTQKKNEDGKPITYRIAEGCSKALWKYQNLPVMVDGKVKIDYLETITGQKMKIMTLYPISVYEIVEKE